MEKAIFDQFVINRPEIEDLLRWEKEWGKESDKLKTLRALWDYMENQINIIINSENAFDCIRDAIAQNDCRIIDSSKAVQNAIIKLLIKEA
jgi:hypothetical protein